MFKVDVSVMPRQVPFGFYAQEEEIVESEFPIRYFLENIFVKQFSDEVVQRLVSNFICVMNT